MSDSYKVYASKDYVENKIEESRVQPDWNQNDPNAADYVKNRTHYKGSEIEEVLFDGYVIISDSWNEEQGIPVGFDVRMDAQYIVMFDGTEYVLEPVMDDYEIPYIGTADIWYGFWSSEATYNVPFAYGNGWFGAIEEGQHTVTIIQKAQAIHTLSPEYLPNIPEDLLPEITADMLPAIPESNLPERTLLWDGKLYYKPILTFDGVLTNDTITVNSMRHCLVSEEIFDVDMEKTYHTRRWLPSWGSKLQSLDMKPIQGDNCINIGYCYIVTEAGTCSVNGYTFTASKKGVYFQCLTNGTYTTDISSMADEDAVSGCASENALVLKSATKAWQITVDDIGVLTATQVVE